MKIVSSPEIVPTTSGQFASSIATVTLWACPLVVFTTVREGPAIRTACTKCATAAKGHDTGYDDGRRCEERDQLGEDSHPDQEGRKVRSPGDAPRRERHQCRDRNLAEEKMGALTGGLKIPGLM